MTVIVFLRNGSKMVFVNTKFNAVVNQIAKSGLKVDIWRFQFHSDKLQNDLTELAKDIEVTYFRELSQ